MSKKLETIIGLVVLFGVIFGFAYGIIWTRPSKDEVQAKRTVDEIAVPKNVLELEVAQRIQQLEVNGAVPVTVSPEELGRDNPFAPF